MKDPVTADDWQVAVDVAQAAMALDSARQYGLVEGGPIVNVRRCVRILERGESRGVIPSPDAVERFIRGLAIAAALRGGGGT